LINPAFRHINKHRTSQTARSLFDRVEKRPVGRSQDELEVQKNTYSTDLKNDTNVVDLELHNSLVPDTVALSRTDASPDTICNFNLKCTKPDCVFAHQSPAAPPGIAIDVHDNCPFAAACQNRKCVARHPSPAQRRSYQAEQDCKFFPNCTNAKCPFRHPSTPVCRNGADCTRAGCKFAHVNTACKYNPCLNPQCPYRHEDGQKKGPFRDKVWKAGREEPDEHVSERKYVTEDGEEEELIVPANQDVGSSQTEIIT